MRGCPGIRYKRLVENVWAPVNVSWAYENRLASVRIISPPLGSREATRLEVVSLSPSLVRSVVLGRVVGNGDQGMEDDLSFVCLGTLGSWRISHPVLALQFT